MGAVQSCSGGVAGGLAARIGDGAVILQSPASTGGRPGAPEGYGPDAAMVRPGGEPTVAGATAIPPGRERVCTVGAELRGTGRTRAITAGGRTASGLSGAGAAKAAQGRTNHA